MRVTVCLLIRQAIEVVHGNGPMPVVVSSVSSIGKLIFHSGKTHSKEPETCPIFRQ